MLGGHVNRGREASQRKGAAGGAVLESFAVEAWQQRGALKYISSNTQRNGSGVGENFI